MLWWVLRQIKADDWRIREDAANKLGEFRDPKGIEPLINALSDKNPHVRQAVENALINYGSLAVGQLIDAFKHQESQIREAAQMILSRIGAPAAGALGSALRGNDFMTRESAAVTLALMNEQDALDQLAATVKLGDANAKEIAAAGLVKIGQAAVKPLAAVLKENRPGVRETAAAALVRIGPRAIEPLIAALKDGEVREAALEALSKIDVAWTKSVPARIAVPTLIGALQDESDRGRKTAAVVLGQIGDSRAVEPLMAVILDSSDVVQEAVASALGEIGDPRAVEALGDCIKMGATKGRKASIDALVKMGNSAIRPLIEALKHKDSEVREAAATVLVRVGHAAVEPLVDVLWKIDPDWAKSQAVEDAVPQFVAMIKEGSNVLLDSAASLKKAGGTRVVKPLVAALKAKDAVLSKGTIFSDQVSGASDVEALAVTLDDANADVRQAAIKRLIQIGTGAEDPLVDALKNENPAIRRAAAHSLAEAQDMRSRDVLRADLRNTPDSVMLDAAEALIQLGDIDLVQPLAHLLKRLNENPNRASIQHKEDRAVRMLQALLQYHAAELEAEDLKTLSGLQPPPEAKFVASADQKARFAAFSSSGDRSGSDSEPAASGLAEAARRELSRRSAKG